MDSVANAQARTPGAILAAERERQGLAPADIAQRLHMSVWQVEALESGEYTRLPRGPFLRGFVRNYAKALGLPPENVLARLAEAAPADKTPGIVVPSQNIRFDPLGERMANPYVKAAGLAALVIVLGFATMYWWVFVRPAPQPAASRKAADVAAAPAVRQPVPTPPASTPAPAPVPAPAPIAETQPAPAMPPIPPAMARPPKAETLANAEPPAKAPVKTEASKTEAAKTEAPKSEAAKAEVPKPDAVKAAPATVPVAATRQGGVIKLRFKGKSWVEVRDAGGKVLLTGMNDAGSETEVSGKPPFKVVVGNAPDVRLFFNDRELNLEPHMREAVARVTVE